MNIESFKEAFDIGAISCRGICECGRVYYNSDGGWDWEENELELLETDNNAFDLDCGIAVVKFMNKEFIYQCDCWFNVADKFMQIIDNHAFQIAQYLKFEKVRLQEIVDSMPTVEN